MGPSCDAKRPRYRDVKTLFLLLLLGLTGVFAYNVFFFSGLKTVTASRASLIIAANPAFIALFSRLLFKEKLGFMRAAGIFISIAGATAVICKGSLSVVLHGRLGVGELYILGCVASWVSYSLLGKKALRNVPPLAAVTGACVMGTMCLIGACPSRRYSVSNSNLFHFCLAGDLLPRLFRDRSRIHLVLRGDTRDRGFEGRDLHQYSSRQFGYPGLFPPE